MDDEKYFCFEYGHLHQRVFAAKVPPFIQKHHGDFNYLFWFDLTGEHYSN